MEALRIYLKEVRKIPLLTAEQEVALSKRLRYKRDEQARKEMIRSNLRLVINMSKRYMYLGIPLLDLIEEGNLGLMRAVDKFDHKKGFRLSTYAAWWIRQSITRSISEQGKLIRVPVYMNELIAKWKKTKERLAQRLKCNPTDDEIAKRLKLSKEKREQVNFWLTSTTSSLEAPINEEDSTPVMDLLENKSVDAPDASTKRMMEKEKVDSLLEGMSKRERQILDMRFGLVDGKANTLAEIARQLGVSRERIRQIEKAALNKLKKFVE